MGPFPPGPLAHWCLIRACCPQLKEHPERGVYVKGLSMHTVHSVAQCERIMETGWKNRSVGYTLMNKDSSRSHSIFTISIEIYAVGTWSRTGVGAGRSERVPAPSSQGSLPPGASGTCWSLGRDAAAAWRKHGRPRPHARTPVSETHSPNSNSSNAGGHHGALAVPCTSCARIEHEHGWGLQDGASLSALARPVRPLPGATVHPGFPVSEPHGEHLGVQNLFCI